MASKKAPPPKAKAKPAPSRLQNLAARPANIDDTLDEQLVDHSGVFRVTSALTQAQIGRGEEQTRFPSDSLVMHAQRDGFRDEGPTIDEELVVVDETAAAEKRARLATLTARAQRSKPRR